MAQQARRYWNKYEALDFTVGKYHPRQLSRQRFYQNDFLEFLSGLSFEDEDIPQFFSE